MVRLSLGRCSLLEMQRLNDELMTQNEQLGREVERLTTKLDEATSDNKLADAHGKIRALEELLMDVGPTSLGPFLSSSSSSSSSFICFNAVNFYFEIQFRYTNRVTAGLRAIFPVF